MAQPHIMLFASLACAWQRRRREFNTQSLSNTTWSWAAASSTDTVLFALLAAEAGCRMSAFKQQGLTNIAWAFAKASQADARLFASMAVAADRHLEDGDLNLQQFVNAAWAHATAGQGCTQTALRHMSSRTRFMGGIAVSEAKERSGSG
eukprot:gnl/TRDRNA2_/TRDRNA2_128034_c2_seq1.p1 gnl/TRDRNA2_/TRDRNA2_128034_c2~~gnl/TRDRNA2_/TRDRNA2_128034_c2_seq1.p1  ORF type:complete len:149 (+),score=21.91 gnl/TRDRNA2_/TRDRNA2_128034_c2_seq1:83-529(+)